ncbi:Phenylalanyl-tRNA synthetase subunit beta [Ignavibacterium album JCM 16511]|uniref:Phenylalanine--tRNA ligase beta subunit n=1 Tax=Ignavibacterium album (strain DSM 19864 / JCM 16511 / NBRC 101810 / Mat9-16) TaxID=945713 RepID=I0AJJ3_IGNAJ|nr:phenylalanine--tRNA ligase subunit beta [Ignavibacterium album]AFH49150.1 Phenylalanyl-tRNA synthetase subunit beta [Ignavibacterium album JCM 16511]
MKISLNWLKEYIDLSNLSTDEIVDKLTMSGLEVEDVIDENQLYKNFIVAEVKSVAKHPNADKLSVCEVYDGKENLQVICGAPNVAQGQKVVFAPIGTIIPNGNFQIKKAKIRGVESNGMICAEDELLLSDDHSGIMVLNEKLEAGKPITEVLNLNDVIFEIAVTPNRPDALSHIGVARDLSAIFNRDLHIPEINIKESKNKASEIASVEIIDITNCPRYSAKVVLNVEVKESPEWLKNRLTKIGLRPINNVVDVTNFILHEIGQPLHAFDLDLLEGKKIIVKNTTEEKEFVTLDSKVRKLPKGTLMICDAKREVAVAGVMGGENSEINPSTKNILIESAYFNPSSIRRTSKALQLSTDSSYRFERGTDPSITKYAAERAAQLIAEVSGGEVAEGIIDVYSKVIERKDITLRYQRVTKILGYEISKEKIHQILHRLGIALKDLDENSLLASVPTFRPDIEREIDLIEEIARVDGYDNIPVVPKISITLEQKVDQQKFEDEVRNIISSFGFYEMINNPLESEWEARLTGNPITLANPQSVEMSCLRTSLLAGALNSVKRNLNFGVKDMMLFEIGNVFNKKSESVIDTFDDISEKQNLILILSGKEEEKSWHSQEKYFDFYSLKGFVNAFTRKISLDNQLTDLYYSSENEIYSYYQTKNFKSKVVGVGGKVKKDVLNKFDINQDVLVFEFDLSELKQITPEAKKYIEPPKFPKIIRDFAFVFDKSIQYLEVKDFILSKASALLKNVELFDIFESESLGSDKKSMAFTLEYFDESRTLTEDEVEKDFNYLITEISKKFNAKLRG